MLVKIYLFVFFFFSSVFHSQFQPVLVNKDQQQTQGEKSRKSDRKKSNTDPVVAVKSSASATGPQASA